MTTFLVTVHYKRFVDTFPVKARNTADAYHLRLTDLERSRGITEADITHGSATEQN